jgi:enolase
MMNIINGGAHADNNVDMQEFMVLPLGAPRFSEAHALGGGGLPCPQGPAQESAPVHGGRRRRWLRARPAVQRGRHRSHPGRHREGRVQAGSDIALGLDVASSEFYKDGHYELASEGKRFDSAQFVDYLARWVDAYPIVTIEDGMAEGDWDGWELLTARLGSRVQLVGDDLFVTNTEILRQGIARQAANSILIKPNQIGTLTETLAAIAMAEAAGFTSVVSHRSGETEDTTIADLSVCTAATQIKTGSLCRSDRMAKYNRLLLIEAELGSAARFAGRGAIRALR